jgi:FAD/FMN-containing dehydrogenase
MKDIKDILDFKKVLEKSQIDFSVEESQLEKYSFDTSLFKIKPKIIIFPKNKFELSAVLKFIFENEGFSLAARSAGTDMGGGPLTNSVSLSFTKYFNKIIEINEPKKFSILEPGVYYKSFEKEILKHNLLFPPYPASKDLCAFGGIVSNNSGGELSLLYGKTENYIEELECVLANGEIVNFKAMSKAEFEQKIIKNKDDEFQKTLEYKIQKDIFNLLNNEKNKKIIERNKPKVSKNSAGYYLWNILKENKNQNESLAESEEIFDLSKLIVGSQGTLALITKIKLKLITPKKHKKMMVIFLKELKDLGSVREFVMKYSPQSFESYDDNTMKVALKFWPLILKRIIDNHKLKKEKINFFKLLFSFWPEVKAFLKLGFPKIFLIAEFADDSEKEILKNLLKLQSELEMLKTENKVKIYTEIIKTKTEEEKFWIVRRESFNLLRQKMKSLRTAPFIEDIVVKGEDFKDFLEELLPILQKYKLYYTVAGHVGDGNIHIIPLMNLTDKKLKKENLKIIKNCGEEVYNLVKKYQGSVTGEHNDGLIRTFYLDKMYDQEMLELFVEVKNIFDRKNILNPGKKVYGEKIEEILKKIY